MLGEEKLEQEMLGHEILEPGQQEQQMLGMGMLVQRMPWMSW